MRKQTNLAEVKLTALALLSTEINETPYSPMIVKHPFTDTGVSATPDGKGGVEMIDLTEDDAQLTWRQSMARQIDKADNAYAIYKESGEHHSCHDSGEVCKNHGCGEHECAHN